jgi:alpha-beta hydrolase superfamily lysophospholipase
LKEIDPKMTLRVSLTIFCWGFTLFLPVSGDADDAPKTSWHLTRSAALTENLVETLWTAKLPPTSRYNTVGVRRLAIRERAAYEGVLVHLPGSSSNGNFYTTSENYDFRVYLANRGYDVYTVEYRTSFIPETETDYSCMATYKTSATLADLRKIIEFVKQKTGRQRIFLSGHSTGARYVYLYACARTAADLAGMIPMDGSPWELNGRPAPESTMDIYSGYTALASGDTEANRKLFQSWGLEPDTGYYNVRIMGWGREMEKAMRTYYSPPPYGPQYGPFAGFPTVSAYIAEQLQNIWGEAQFTNIKNGYAKVDVMMNMMSKIGVPWPLVDYLEDAYLGNWKGNPPEAPLKFLKNIEKIQTPILVFASEMWTTAVGYEYRWKREGYEMIKSADRQYILLKGFGHMDILAGEKAKNEVFVPLYNWLQAHK